MGFLIERLVAIKIVEVLSEEVFDIIRQAIGPALLNGLGLLSGLTAFRTETIKRSCSEIEPPSFQ